MIGLDQIIGRQLAAARVLVGLSQAELATAARISIATLRRMEASGGSVSGYPNNVESVRRALEQAGIEFTNGGQSGVRLAKRSSEPVIIPADELNAANDE